jgi:hypothetical protein
MKWDALKASPTIRGDSMSRLVALTVAMSLGLSSMTYAGEGLMQAASRIIQRETADKATAPAKPAKSGNDAIAQAFAAQQSGQPVLSKSGMRTRTKVLIYLAAGVGLASAAWAIDHKVLDVTPSSLGTRRDGCKPFCGSPQ